MNLLIKCKAFLIIIVFLTTNSSLFSQRWMDQMYEGVDFKTIQEDFYKEWEGKEYRKGSGYKQFKRWEHFMEPRVYPDNKAIPANRLWEEYVKQQQRASNVSCSLDWSSLGPQNWENGYGWNPGNGRINAIEEDPNDSNTIYVGVPAGGCWKSVDGGSSWACLTDDMPVLGVSGIAIDPTNSNIVYIATGDGDGSNTYSIGVLKSLDGGATWSTTGLSWTNPSNIVSRRLIIDPNNTNVLFCATSDGLYKTSDAGVNWTNVQSGSMQDVELHPADSNIVYTVSDAFYRSTDGGNSFTYITNGLPASGAVNRYKIAVSPNQPDYVYAVAGKESDATFLGLYRSSNGGSSFSTRSTSPNIFGYESNGGGTAGQSSYDLAITVNPNNADEVIVGGINLWKSTNGGSSFGIITQWQYGNSIGYVHADIHDLAYFGNNLYSGSDGGIFKSTNNGSSWTDLTEGIVNMQFYAMDHSQTNVDIVLGGSQDNGTNLYQGNGLWRHSIGADGMECLVNYANNNIMFGTIQFGTLYKSTNGFGSASEILTATSRGENGGWISPLKMDPNDPNTIYIGYQDLHKSTNGGSSWTAISNFDGSVIDAVSIAPSNSNYIYMIKYNTVYATANGGSNWTNITAGLPNLIVSDIAIDPNDPQRIWASLSGYQGGQRVYYSGNAGGSWSNYSAGLPAIPGNTIEYLPESNDGLYLGTDMGIYYIDSNMSAWESCMAGLPSVIVTDIDIACNIGKIRAATYGRGIWEADVLCASEPAANLTCVTQGSLTINESVIDIAGVEVKNIGILDAESFEVGFYLSSDQDFTTADYFLGSNTVNPLAINEGAILNFNVDYNIMFPNLPSGVYYVGYIVDYQNVVVEYSEVDNNNCSWIDPNIVLCNNGETLNLNLFLDNYPEETSWALKDTLGNVLFSGGPFPGMPAATLDESMCVDPGCYVLHMYDLYEDGMCCGYGEGHFSLTREDGTELASGGDFGNEGVYPFCIDSLPVGPNLTCFAQGTLTINESLIDIAGLEVKNIGNVDAATFEVGFYLSVDQDFSTTDYFLGSSTIGNLPVNGLSRLDFNVDYNSMFPDLSSGTYHVGYIVDYQDVILEYAEADNSNCSWADPKISVCAAGQALNLNLFLDNYPEETSWEVLDEGGAVVVSGGPYPDMQAARFDEKICIPGGCYVLHMKDLYQDGMCCGYGEGHFSLTDQMGTEIASGGDFGHEGFYNFCLCVNDLVKMETVATGDYSAGRSVTSAGKIAAPNVVAFNGGQYIDLTAEFEVELGADFTAQIQGCGVVSALNATQSERKEVVLEENQFYKFKSTPEQRALDVKILAKDKKKHLLVAVNLPNPGRLQLWLLDENQKKKKYMRLKGKSEAGVYLLKLNQQDFDAGKYYIKVRSGRANQVVEFNP